MFARHGTLTPNVVTTIVIDGDATAIEVVNVDGIAEIFFTVDGSTPTVNGDNTYVLPATISSRVVCAARNGRDITVSLISSGSTAYTVSADV